MARTHIAEFLAGHGFAPDLANPAANPARVSGRSRDCRLLVADVAPQGWHRDILRRFASADDQFFFIFRGRKYEGQPVWRTRLSYYWNRLVRRLGVNESQVGLVYGIVASPACDVNAIPWLDLDDPPLV